MAKVFGIKVLANASGIMPHTIRIWEKRYGVFGPSRSDTGRREYTEEDLNKITLLSKLINAGHKISRLAPLSVGELEELVESLPKSQSAVKVAAHTSRLVSAVGEFDLSSMALELDHLRTFLGARDFLYNVVLPLMREIGEMVAHGEYSVTQEHLCSSLIRDQLSKFSIPCDPKRVKRVVLATPEGNIHEMSIQIADTLCKLHRIPTFYLGAAHPGADLGEAINYLGTEVLVLGAISSEKWEYKSQIADYLQLIDQTLSNPIDVCIGGSSEKVSFPKFKNIRRVETLSSFEEFEDYLVKLF